METKAANKTGAELRDKICAFINEAGIDCREGAIPEQTFLPGIDIQKGNIIFDPERLAHPGDLLHEAGHMAVLRPKHRPLAGNSENISGDITPAAAEMAAIAWSWAACRHLQLAPEVLFHEAGYKGG